MLRIIQTLVDSESGRIEDIDYKTKLLDLVCLACERPIGMVVDEPTRLILGETTGPPDSDVIVDRLYEIIPAPPDGCGGGYGGFYGLCRLHGLMRFEEAIVVHCATEALAGRPGSGRIVGTPDNWSQARWQAWADSKNRPQRDTPGARRLRSVS